MSILPLDNFAWERATTLAERCATSLPTSLPDLAAEDELFRYRLQSWQTQSPFGLESYFAQRLTLDGLNDVTFRALLAESGNSLRARFSHFPSWWRELGRTLSQPCETDFTTLLPDERRNQPTIGFLFVAAPFIERALARFDAGVAAIVSKSMSLPFDPATIKKILFALLPDQLLAMVNRTLVLEMNIARLSGELEGTTPEARFQSFIARLKNAEYRYSILQNYPVLARLLFQQTQRWASVCLQFLSRLCNDWQAIKSTFFPGDPGVLVSVKGGLADTHRGGHSVFIVKFRAGDRLVYKPKSLRVDVHFQQFLQWMNQQGAAPHFPTMAVLERKGYGWVEFAKAISCQSPDEVQRFYQRQGGYLALLYLLDATDFHAGNLIAAGEFPYLIDLEALFHPRREEFNNSADSRARYALSHSVLHIGLLPERAWSNSESEGVDTSGLGTIENQLTPLPHPQWEETGTDTMRLVRKRKLMRTEKNRPQLAGRAVNVLDYQGDILAGFASTYSLLQQQRDALLAPTGPLAPFAKDEVSVFLRSMRTYRRLLRESYHPDVLRDALDRDRLFDLLWVEVPDEPELAQVIQIEREDLWGGDIPIFTTRPASRDLWVSKTKRIKNFFPEPSFAVVQRRIRQMSQDDCERQMYFIRASFASLPQEPPARRRRSHSKTTAPIHRERLLAAAQILGDRLEATAFHGEGEINWIGLMQEPGRAWFINALGFDLEAGLPGVALFLAYLGELTRQERYTVLANGAVKTLMNQLAARGNEPALIGAFDGLGGVIYALTQLGVLWQRRDLLTQARSIVNQLPASIGEDEDFDLHGGAAGCIIGLNSLAQVAPSQAIIQRITRCGDHLLKHLQASLSSNQWQAKVKKPYPLASYLFGLSGISWALLQAHTRSGIERFRQGALNALQYERSHLDETSPDWKGMGLARLNSLLILDDPQTRGEITKALAIIQRQVAGENDSLFFGDGGNLELLLLASRGLRTDQWKSQIEAYAQSMLTAVEKRAWVSGTPQAIETPGLATGIAGIGYQLLRVAAPETVPSILSLESLQVTRPSQRERSKRGARRT